MPGVARRIAESTADAVLICGPTGSGRSTLAEEVLDARLHAGTDGVFVGEPRTFDQNSLFLAMAREGRRPVAVQGSFGEFFARNWLERCGAANPMDLRFLVAAPRLCRNPEGGRTRVVGILEEEGRSWDLAAAGRFAEARARWILEGGLSLAAMLLAEERAGRIAPGQTFRIVGEVPEAERRSADRMAAGESA